MKDQTKYETIATMCRRAGRLCPAAAFAADQLAHAASLACDTAPTFSMNGQLWLEGCAQGCPAQFIFDRNRVELFCGVEADVNLGDLCAFSDSFLGTGRTICGIGKLDAPPRAIVRKYIGPTIMPEPAQMTVTG